MPRAVTAAPDLAPGAHLVYAATGQRVYVLDPATGGIVKSGLINGFGEAPRVVRAADGRIYVETLHDIFGFNAALVQQWDYFLDDDPAAISAPGDGFLYLNDEDQVGSTGFPQCMEKANGSTGQQAARNCKVDDFMVPTAVPSRNSVAGAGTVGIFDFWPSNPSVKWVNKVFPALGAASGTADQGGRVAGAGRVDLRAVAHQRRPRAVPRELRREAVRLHPAGLRARHRRQLRVRRHQPVRRQGVGSVRAGLDVRGRCESHRPAGNILDGGRHGRCSRSSRDSATHAATEPGAERGSAS